MTALKPFIFVCCMLFTIVFKSEAAESMQDRSLYEARKILQFICLHTSCKPNISEQDQRSYLNEIMRCLENKQVFSTITTLLIGNALSPHQIELTQSERGLLLSLCLYQHSKNTQLYWSKVSEAVGVFPDLNIFFDAVHLSHPSNTDYATYQIAPNKVLVLQLVARGNHNHSYLLWHVTLDSGNLNAVLLDIPHYSEQSQSFHNTPEILAKSCFYDFDAAHFIVNVNIGDVNHWKEEENTYQIKDDKLTLLQSCIHKKECKTSFPTANVPPLNNEQK